MHFMCTVVQKSSQDTCTELFGLWSIQAKFNRHFAKGPHTATCSTVPYWSATTCSRREAVWLDCASTTHAKVNGVNTNFLF